jgi:hypothetical protein
MDASDLDEWIHEFWHSGKFGFVAGHPIHTQQTRNRP